MVMVMKNSKTLNQICAQILFFGFAPPEIQQDDRHSQRVTLFKTRARLDG